MTFGIPDSFFGKQAKCPRCAMAVPIVTSATQPAVESVQTDLSRALRTAEPEDHVATDEPEVETPGTPDSPPAAVLTRGEPVSLKTVLRSRPDATWDG